MRNDCFAESLQTSDGVLFRIYAQLLAQHSVVWANMLSVPRPPHVDDDKSQQASISSSVGIFPS